MTDLTSTDRRLLAALKHDGRASITTLSAQLGVSRATLQTRLDRLVKTKIIERFTIDVDLASAPDIVRAVMLIEVQGAHARAIIRQVQKMPEIISLHTTNGAWDLVAMIQTSSLPEFDHILRDVRDMTGVLNSQTCLLLDTAKG